MAKIALVDDRSELIPIPEDEERGGGNVQMGKDHQPPSDKFGCFFPPTNPIDPTEPMMGRRKKKKKGFWAVRGLRCPDSSYFFGVRGFGGFPIPVRRSIRAQVFFAVCLCGRIFSDLM